MHVDHFSQPSALTPNQGLFLCASPTGAAQLPFFSGVLRSPRRSADLLLAVSKVVRTRFYTPPGMLARILQAKDPVITCGEAVLRFEGFSECCGVYARLDLLEDALEFRSAQRGAANVDFNPEMRAALSRLRDGETAALTVSREGMSLKSARASAFEKSVDLPERWVRGFAEAQAHQAAMDFRFESSATEATRFFRSLTQRATRGVQFAHCTAGPIQWSQNSGQGRVPVGGPERLRILNDIVRHAQRLYVYSNESGTSAWRLDTPDSRFWLVLSPSASRGLSGEGQHLSDLAGSGVDANLQNPRLEPLLRWQDSIDLPQLAQALEISTEAARAQLAQLSLRGRAGFDLATCAFFHRELPFSALQSIPAPTRLTAAKALKSSNKLSFAEDGKSIWVRGKDAEYLVRRTAEGEWRCTCAWIGRHGTSRGPCKHILAATLFLQDQPNASQ